APTEGETKGHKTPTLIAVQSANATGMLFKSRLFMPELIYIQTRGIVNARTNAASIAVEKDSEKAILNFEKDILWIKKAIIATKIKTVPGRYKGVDIAEIFVPKISIQFILNVCK